MTASRLDTLRLLPSDALFLDFDGTLAEIGPDPDAIRLQDGLDAVLMAVNARITGGIAIISGRDLRDLAGRVPDGLWRLGGHGLEILPPGAAVPPPPDAAAQAIRAPLERLVAERPGTRLEVKGQVLALHYRAAPDAEARVLEAAAAAAAAAPDLKVQPGKMVVEVKPTRADKGAALHRMCTSGPFAGRRPVMLGDDRTDEDAMAAAQALGGIGVKIGDGESCARMRAASPAEVRAWLAREAAA